MIQEKRKNFKGILDRFKKLYYYKPKEVVKLQK